MYDPRFIPADERVVEHVLGLRVQRTVDADHVADADQRLHGLVERQAELLLNAGWEPVPVRVVEVHVERLHPLQHAEPYPPGCHDAHVHPLDVVRAGDRVGDVPAAPDHPAVLRDVVPDERQHLHHGVLRDADAVAPRHLAHRDAPVDGGLQVDVVGPDAGGDRQLEPGGLRDALGGQVSGPEGLGDDDVRVGQLPLEDGVGAVLVRGDNEPVPPLDQEPLQPESARYGPQEMTGGEVEGGRRGQRLAVRVLRERGYLFASVGGREAGHRVVVENAEYFLGE